MDPGRDPTSGFFSGLIVVACTSGALGDLVLFNNVLPLSLSCSRSFHRTMAERLVAKLDSTQPSSHQQTPLLVPPTTVTDGYMPMATH